ncbi:hypothetical protein [Bacillus thuringiensis]|uniref:hypothetical protein n=1 Tax=Bacillus thuringiensis TaxID=1428 RepID=UPI0011559F30|nr:hypothetical protein [Bacillus thuringiensis]
MQNIERDWNALRLRHGIPDGQALHFTDIRHLLVSGKPASAYKAEWLAIFSKTKSSTSTDIDYTRMHAFFTDVVEFIKNHDFIIQATGLRYDKRGLIRNISNRYFKDSTYRPPYYAFREHLNIMGTYLLSISTGTFNPQGHTYLTTKLRFDGDVDLGERDDLREAFNHCISLGTRHFRPNFTKKIFDEIRFIGKNEVGDSRFVSHAGNEITDFIATIVSRYMWNIDTHLIPVSINGMPSIDTLTAIQSKLFNSQKLDDNFL